MNDCEEKNYLQILERKVADLEQENLKLQTEIQDLHVFNEKFYKAFHNSQTVIVISKIEDGVIIDINETFAKILGYQREEMIGQSVFDLGIWSTPDDRLVLLDRLKEHGYVRHFESDYRKRSGKTGNADLSVSILELNGERCLLTSGIDITQRKNTENELRRSQDLFWQVFNNIPLPVIIVTLKDKRIVEYNDTFLSRNKQVRGSENIGKMNIHMDYWENPAELDRYFDLIKQHGIEKNFEANYHLMTGEKRSVLLSGVAICWQGEECILSITNDITELKAYQKEMSRLESLSIIGQMAASIAHEIRNPITSVKGFLQLFQGLDRYAEDRDAMDLMIYELDRVNDIISAFLSMAQNRSIELKRLNLNHSIVNLLPLLIADAQKNAVSIETDLQEVAAIMVNEGEIRQLLFNLVRNGIEAMPGGGSLLIKTYEDQNGVNLLIKDKGKGMAADVLEKIGTPFFTTKDNGTGLGMVVCYSIAERHHASISIDSNSEGTSFVVLFPAAGDIC